MNRETGYSNRYISRPVLSLCLSSAADPLQHSQQPFDRQNTSQQNSISKCERKQERKFWKGPRDGTWNSAKMVWLRLAWLTGWLLTAFRKYGQLSSHGQWVKWHVCQYTDYSRLYTLTQCCHNFLYLCIYLCISLCLCFRHHRMYCLLYTSDAADE